MRKTNVIPTRVRSAFIVVGCALLVALSSSCGSGSAQYSVPNSVVVNSLDDLDQPPAGKITLRSAIALATAGQTIRFDPALDGGTIQLKLIADEHTTLMGETYTGMTYAGYAQRDYGKSALFATKSLIIDASNLSNGITLQWAGGDSSHARVLAVMGNLNLTNVSIVGGYSSADALTGGTQPFTLARGGGLAVWGTAVLRDCAIVGNRVSGDSVANRDRGSYGGGIYADGLDIDNCTISGNSADGFGAAGGGIYSVGGSDTIGGNNVTIFNSSITGNRVSAVHAYGGGIFTLGGGPVSQALMTVSNCTVARNLVEDNPNLPDSAQPQYYYRGAGLYLGGGSLTVASSTVVENQVKGVAAVFNGAPNMGGGGIAATIGNAHVVENLTIQHSIVAGNQLQGVANDVFSGTVINFYSRGYNLFGVLDFSQALVPAPDWYDLNRKHYPKVGDRDGLALTDVVDPRAAYRSSFILSAGTDAGEPAVLWYPPAAAAMHQIPPGDYSIQNYSVGYTGDGLPTDDFLNQVILQVRARYGTTLGSNFGSDFDDMIGVTFYGPPKTWTTNPPNAPWIAFWRKLDSEIGSKLGPAKLGEEFWSSFTPGPVGNETLQMVSHPVTTQHAQFDQRGIARAPNADIGSVEF